MPDDKISDEGRRHRFEQWERLGVDRVRADLLNGGYRLIGGPPQVKELAWEWVRIKENEQAAIQGRGADFLSPALGPLTPGPTVDDILGGQANASKAAVAQSTAPERPSSEQIQSELDQPKETAKFAHGMRWDVFISHATEDKESFGRQLAERLRKNGLRVWFDEFTLTVGDSLRRSIDRGLAKSRYGIVIVSPAFLRKHWPQQELDGLVAREVRGDKVILPVWHDIDADEIRKQSPILADRLAASSKSGLENVVSELLRAMTRDEKALDEETSKTTLLTTKVPSSPALREKGHKLVIEIENIAAASLASEGVAVKGKVAILFYNMRIANSFPENITLKQVLIRYTLRDRNFSYESTVLPTGLVYSAGDKGDVDSIIIRHDPANVVIMNWKNIRTQIGEYRLLPPGAVLAGSAAFILDLSDAGELVHIRDMGLVINDYSGNETITDINLTTTVIEQARLQVLENKKFVIDRAGKIAYSD